MPQFSESDYEVAPVSGREKAARRPEPNGSVVAAEPQPFRAVPLMRPQMEATLHDQPMSGVMFGSRRARSPGWVVSCRSLAAQPP